MRPAFSRGAVGSDHRSLELDELRPIVQRARLCGIDPRRVLTALGHDARELDAFDPSAPGRTRSAVAPR